MRGRFAPERRRKQEWLAAVPISEADGEGLTTEDTEDSRANGWSRNEFSSPTQAFCGSL
jgi:hypothetical protein